MSVLASQSINQSLQYAAATQVLSLDRTVGGGLFSAVLVLGVTLSAAMLGGGLASLAWLARGQASGLLQYLPAQLQKVPSKYDLGLIAEWMPKAATLPLPDFVQEQFAKIKEEVIQLEADRIPVVDVGFWILLIILPIIFCLPFAVARAGDARLGIVIATGTLFLGSQILFATLLPTLGLRLYWTQMVAGYAKVGLVNAGAMAICGLFFLSTSAHDAVRMKLGALLEGTGALLSHSASIVALSALRKNPGNGSDPHLNVSTEAVIAEAVCREVQLQAEEEAASLTGKYLPSNIPLDEESSAGGYKVPSTVQSALDLQGFARTIEGQLGAVS